MGYFGHEERHWHQQPLCALKAQTRTPVQQCTFACNERRGVGGNRWVGLYLPLGILGSEILQIAITGVVDSYV